MTKHSRLLAVSVVVVVLTSCGQAPSKSGGNIAVVTVRATSTGESDTPGGDLMEAIKSKAAALSYGAIDVTIGNLADGENGLDQDGAAIKLVRNGGADIAVVRSAAFSMAGVNSFAALQAPFLIDNEQVAESVAADPIGREMLGSLDRIGLVGLAVAPGGLRHPFGWNKRLVGLSDYANATINTRPGLEVDKLFKAFGARTDHSVGQERSTAATDGTLNGVEVSLQQRLSTGPPMIMTANVVLYSKFDVVIVNKKFLNGLSHAQQDAVRNAVTAAIPATLAARPTETAAFADWCAQPGNVALLASASELADLKNAAAPVTADLESDAFTKKAIARIRQLDVGAKPTELEPCRGPQPTSVTIEAAGDQSVIDGTWRIETTLQGLVDVGVSPSDAAKDVGVSTWVLHNGTLSGETPTIPCHGTYKINGNMLSWAFNPDSCGGAFQGTFVRDGDHLTFNVDPAASGGSFFVGFFKGGLTRIGDVPG